MIMYVHICKCIVELVNVLKMKTLVLATVTVKTVALMNLFKFLKVS